MTFEIFKPIGGKQNNKLITTTTKRLRVTTLDKKLLDQVANGAYGHITGGMPEPIINTFESVQIPEDDYIRIFSSRSN